jgi:hypothetical protein
MKLLFILLFLAILFWGFSVPFIIRADARARADHIINGRRPSTEKSINSCISFLTWSNKWITSKAHVDLIRIRKLNVILKEMQKPHS